ncbi:Transmembrane emp24 domain-containing protein p24delta9 [Camellia lanceoleosa]|uniref:Transmembrane emp24 domain-containing protein p24delta9 n=1 Tax=Camellia lanceoleosa TaxID=1840588 RepID=A0ACC0HK53_9ERIC|nr:Transmembrane emp24 domain-containing protein p24delta9 [Camellia lanceoleosa]
MTSLPKASFSFPPTHLPSVSLPSVLLLEYISFTDTSLSLSVLLLEYISFTDTSLSISVLPGFTVISLLLLILLGFISNAAQSLRFDLQSGHSKCIAEYIKTNSMSVAKYTIVNPNDPHPFPESHKITVRFLFKVPRSDYMTCFWALDHKPQSTITIDFDWKTGVAAKDWNNVAKKGTIDSLIANGIFGRNSWSKNKVKKDVTIMVKSIYDCIWISGLHIKGNAVDHLNVLYPI